MHHSPQLLRRLLLVATFSRFSCVNGFNVPMRLNFILMSLKWCKAGYIRRWGAPTLPDRSVFSLSVVTTGCKHNFLFADRAFVSRALIHHLEYFRHICDQLSSRDRSISIRVDLVHHFFGLKTTSIASSCEG